MKLKNRIKIQREATQNACALLSAMTQLVKAKTELERTRRNRGLVWNPNTSLNRSGGFTSEPKIYPTIQEEFGLSYAGAQELLRQMRKRIEDSDRKDYDRFWAGQFEMHKDKGTDKVKEPEAKVWTLDDLKNGKVACVNDGTLEELREVLNYCFPEDCYAINGRCKYYYASNDRKRWIDRDGTSAPTQSVKVFHSQLPKQKPNAAEHRQQVTEDSLKDKSTVVVDAEQSEPVYTLPEVKRTDHLQLNHTYLAVHKRISMIQVHGELDKFLHRTKIQLRWGEVTNEIDADDYYFFEYHQPKPIQ